MLNEVRPVIPVAPYQGGKIRLAKRLIARINARDHTGYAEPFVGMGGIFFRRNRQPTVEVINDISGEITTLFRVLQRHYRYLIDFMRFQIPCRAEFDRLKQINPLTLTDLELGPPASFICNA